MCLGGVGMWVLAAAVAAAAPEPPRPRGGVAVSDRFVEDARAHDASALERVGEASADLAAVFEPVFGTLDFEAKELAIRLVTAQGWPGAGDWLLRRTSDGDVNVTGDAVEALGRLASPPPPAALLQAARGSQDPFIREKLYLLAGRSPAPGTLELLRAAAAGESHPEAARALLAARAKLGGAEERRALRGLVATTRADGALEMQDVLLYVGEPWLARGLLPWLASRRGVMRLGSDRQGGAMARQCDLAVWTAHLLKVPLPFSTSHLRNYPDRELAAARTALEALPE